MTLGKTLSAAVLLAFAAMTPAGAEERLLADIFQDHAVLQRSRPINIWGRAAPGTLVAASLADAKVETRAGDDGRWRATFPPLTAGGPYTLAARAENERSERIEDVLIGDVWLCSGQSNMALEVRRTLNADSEISGADDHEIRMVTIPTAASLMPLDHFPSPIAWRVTSPETVGEFSAACYYFARALRKTDSVPMGLVVSAWGGSRIETWISGQGLETIGLDDERLNIVRLAVSDRFAAARRWGDLWETWWKERAPMGDEPWRPETAGDGWLTAPNIGYWNHWGDLDFADYTGLVWYRTHIRLAAGQAAQKATLVLGAVDEIDQTWVNGIAVGGGSDGVRAYEIPPDVLRAGDNEIFVNIVNTWGPGGLIGPADIQAIRFADGSSVALTGPWRIKKVPAAYGHPPRAPWEALGGLSMAYNAMIAPIVPYGFRGALWYQGESNTGDAAHYKAYLAGLMADWRARFGAELPFLVVQLAGYGPAPVTPQESGWAEVREAQRMAAAEDAHAGLAVTIDIGDRYDIHPPNKQEIGRRLARAARHVVYREKLSPSGPVPLGAKLEKNGAVVTFSDIDSGLVAYGAAGPVGFELCGAAGDCRYAEARLEGDRVILALGKKEAPARMRYCWADNPVCTLYDRAGLPAGPFEIAVE